MAQTSIDGPPPVPPECDPTLTTAVDRRAALCRVRTDIALRQDWPDRFIRLVAVEEVHSDDEEEEDGSGSGVRTLIVHAKEGRSPLLGSLFREMDEQARKFALRYGSNTPLGVRKYPLDYDLDPKPSTLPAIPRDVPVDYFDPRYFKTVLISQEREDYREHGVCLPAITHPDVERNKLPFLLATLTFDQESFSELFEQQTLSLYYDVNM